MLSPFSNHKAIKSSTFLRRTVRRPRKVAVVVLAFKVRMYTRNVASKCGKGHASTYSCMVQSIKLIPHSPFLFRLRLGQQQVFWLSWGCQQPSMENNYDSWLSGIESHLVPLAPSADHPAAHVCINQACRQPPPLAPLAALAEYGGLDNHQNLRGGAGQRKLALTWWP